MELNNLETSTPVTDHPEPELIKKCKYLQEFIDSDGWKIIKEEINKQIYENTVAFSSKTEMSSHEVDYRRGGLLMLSSFLTFPGRLLNNYKAQLPLDTNL